VKIYSLRCAALAYRVTTPSKVAIDLDTDVIGRWRVFPDCLHLQVAVEAGDNTARLRAAAKAIRRVVRMTTPTCLVVNGFAGFAAPDAHPEPETARAVLADLIDRLTARPDDLPCHVAPFGWNKQFKYAVLDGEWQQRFIHINQAAPRKEGP